MVRDAFGRAGMRVGYLWHCLGGIGLGWLGVVLVLAWGGLGWGDGGVGLGGVGWGSGGVQ